jgi:hypothetical protein
VHTEIVTNGYEKGIDGIIFLLLRTIIDINRTVLVTTGVVDDPLNLVRNIEEMDHVRTFQVVNDKT